ncbi:putative O-linked N-acetylglucosamine transferase (SPINDLY family) [Azospirillum fermentarium]|uniref:O-linked N-acetylglucosamine transferase, SPINDLY family protein n=1 Tax=Azospirillum fermentarium TaxID=1233114 RepID=UPI002225E793|nr:tetratricopeptide repeat protein [Azospirillum fermentarium]MCW2249405.1 putative O-linked N-acetylglucosamine transferase (SPINDLY family) [Azospirillum fermentarium]
MMPDTLDEAARCLAAGDLDRARSLAGAVLAGASGEPEALFILGSATALAGAPAEAVPLFQRSIAAGGATPERLYNLGLAQHQAGDLAGAERSLFAAILRAPRSAEAHHALGVTLAARGNGEDAAAAFRRAVEEKPDWTEASLNLAAVLAGGRQPQAAFAVYRGLLARHPQNGHFLFLAGTAALNADFLDEAESLLRQALLRAPRDTGTMNNLGLALARMGRVGEAVHMFRQAVGIRADYTEAWFGLAAALDAQGEPEAALAAYRTVAELRPGDPGTDSNLLMMLGYREALTPTELYAAHRRWGERVEAALAPVLAAEPRPAVRPLAGRRLRIGYVSPDFRLHSVAMFLLPLLAAHDRTRVELFAYSNVELPDAVTDHIRRSVDGWRAIQGVTDDAAAAQIRADGIDVLVDLTGHTANNRLGIFAHRPAPVQVSWLGYPATTGLAAINARFTDAVADPPGESDGHHSERLVRLEGGFLCYRPLSAVPDPAPPPCLENGFVTFGSFNTLNKLNPEVAALWARVLHAVPDSRLLLKAGPLVDGSVRRRVLGLFASHGVPAGRIGLRARVPDNDGHLKAYGWMDVALDPFPYNGTTTSCEALWMGVPVLTLPGVRHAARVGASLLTAAGRPDLIAADADDFVAKAAALAADPGRLAAGRQALRPLLQASRLCDAAAFARAFEHQCFALVEGCGNG